MSARIGVFLGPRAKESYLPDPELGALYAPAGADEVGTYARGRARPVSIDGPRHLRDENFPAVFRNDLGRVVIALPRPVGAGYSFDASNRFFAGDAESMRVLRRHVNRLLLPGDRCECAPPIETVARCNQCGLEDSRHYAQHMEDFGFVDYCARCGLRPRA